MKLLIGLLLLSNVAMAQINNIGDITLNKPQITVPFAFFAGMCDGVSQTLYAHYSAFEKRFPEANDQYWNPYQSWTNKYANNDPNMGEKFPGSTTVFVFTTDAYHLFRTINKVNLVTLGALEFSERRPLLNYAIDFLLYSAVYSAGFTLTYQVFFKP
ncbi:MAG: hypothetical protein IPL12_11810 [Bacteroidetes bacterium]|nr:hypothetical protein [Bacteroidota bacterium]MBK8343930.1 hypothetical protein [Bacteroidota bacterium]